MYCSREFQPSTRFIQQYEKSTFNITSRCDMFLELCMNILHHHVLVHVTASAQDFSIHRLCRAGFNIGYFIRAVKQTLLCKMPCIYLPPLFLETCPPGLSLYSSNLQCIEGWYSGLSGQDFQLGYHSNFYLDIICHIMSDRQKYDTIVAFLGMQC